MPYTAYKTWTVGEILTAGNMNAQVRDNGLLGPEALATADGEVWIATGANAGEMVAILNASNLLKRAYGGLEVALVDPNADRILFWDDGAGAYAYLTPGTNLSITGTSLDATGGTEATESDMKDEGTSNADRYVSPETAKFAPGAAKAYGFFNALGTLNAGSHNVTSITNDSTGNFTITWDTDFANDDYTVVEALNGTQGFYVVHTPAVGTIVAQSWDTGASLSNIGHYFAAFGEQ